jgi:hypothetical protein
MKINKELKSFFEENGVLDAYCWNYVLYPNDFENDINNIQYASIWGMTKEGFK